MQISFRDHVSAWRKVIFALFLRDLQGQFNDKLGLGWAFIEPFLFIFGLSFLRSLSSTGDAHGLPILIFMMIGLIAVQSFIQGMPTIASSIQRSKPLFAFRQVQPISPILASTMLEMGIKIGVIVLAIVTLYLMKIDVPVADPLLLIILFVCLWLFTLSLSIIFAVMSAYIEETRKIMSLFMRPFFFISCTFFSLQDIPREFWHWLTWNPLVHFVELARFAVLPSYGDEGVSLSYIMECTLVALFFALALYHITWKSVLSR